MTDRIEVAATELRPLLEEFIMWARVNAPDSDPELVGPAALWHRLAFSSDLGTWKRADLRNLLLDRMPKVVEDPDSAADGMLPAVDAYLTFLSQTGRLTKGSDSLDGLREELDDVEDEFVELMEELLDDAEGDDEGEEETSDLGDFEPFADQLADLPTIRLRPDAELAAAARQAPLIAKARDLAVWVGSGRRVGEDTLLSDAEVEEALAAVGLPRPETEGSLAEAVPQLWNVWNLAVDLEFLEPGEGNTVAVQDDTSEWPFDDDEDVLDAWMLGLHSIDYGDPELPDDDLTMALAGLTRGVLVRLLLAGGSRELDGLRQELADAAAELDELGSDAWEAAGDPLATAVEWLTGYGMVALDASSGAGGTLSLTALGTEGVIHLVDDADIEIDARPAIESMSAHELLALSAELPEEEADAEFAAWMRLREPGRAAEELLEAAAEDESDALIRVQAASVVGTLGEDAVPAWQAALKEPSLRPYAATHLSQLGVEGAPEPTQDDTHWLILDMWTISAGLGRSEFVSSLRDIGPDLLNNLLEVIWKIPHAHVEELLDLISQVHPDKQVAKAARRALFKARSHQ
ncbi:hypothetical protein [Nonomuraea roseoviolacea]|uniref:HEAT repeat domain-containing protein n=1 Tax=Nonomuraea roseoviolacea subsp. carminata TaxID=160689 RepID=A0ABT1K4B7_9ACTN|nr:hypothetical protein [Nonomuraea roseoviolacea]MCP2348845.1 hypothetical protein [Nonomuraea roseoviolacea subsp. carminata]